MINISPASIIKKKKQPQKSAYTLYIYEQNWGHKEADLLFFRGPQRALPGFPDDADVPLPRGVAVGLNNVRQGQATDHGLQDLLHVAEGQKSLGPGAGLHQLHGAGHQRDLARAENRPIHLEKRAGKTRKCHQSHTDEDLSVCFTLSNMAALANNTGVQTHLRCTKIKLTLIINVCCIN